MGLSIQQLTKEQVKELYEKSMMVDFPDNERKPLSIIYHGMDAGTYEPLGVMRGGEIVGYTFFTRSGKDYLLDYYAILRDYRNQGLGSEFLSLVQEYYRDAETILCEVEDPDCAAGAAERELQERRLGFYLRNGFLDTKVRACVFGADYRVLELGRLEEEAHSFEEIIESYLRIYRQMIPADWFHKNVKLRGFEKGEENV